MALFDRMDASASGIKRIYHIQKNKYFPMPDYDLSTPIQVKTIVYGELLDNTYICFMITLN